MEARQWYRARPHGIERGQMASSTANPPQNLASSAAQPCQIRKQIKKQCFSIRSGRALATRNLFPQKDHDKFEENPFSNAEWHRARPARDRNYAHTARVNFSARLQTPFVVLFLSVDKNKTTSWAPTGSMPFTAARVHVALRPVTAKPGQTRPGQGKPGQACSSQAWLARPVWPGLAGQAWLTKPSLFKPGLAKPSRFAQGGGPSSSLLIDQMRLWHMPAVHKC